MNDHHLNTVLLVCSTPAESDRLLDCLSESGFNVLGPVADAAMALALTAQTAPTLALVARKPVGRRKARRLAKDLVDLWGVPSWILPQADDAAPETNPAVQGPLKVDFGPLREALRHEVEGGRSELHA